MNRTWIVSPVDGLVKVYSGRTTLSSFACHQGLPSLSSPQETVTPGASPPFLVRPLADVRSTAAFKISVTVWGSDCDLSHASTSLSLPLSGVVRVDGPVEFALAEVVSLEPVLVVVPVGALASDPLVSEGAVSYDDCNELVSLSGPEDTSLEPDSLMLW